MESHNTWSWSLAVSMTIEADGILRLISRVACNPPMPGMLMSINIRSAIVSSANFTAVSPSLASAATIRSGSRSIRSLLAERNKR